MAEHEALKVGDSVGSFERATGFDNWNRYAAVNDEFVPIHMDDDAGREAGYPTAFGMGTLQWAYLHNLLRDWVGENGRIISLSCQFRAPNIKGQTVTAHGTITALNEIDGETVVELDVWTEDQDGSPLAPGHAVVALAG